MVTNLSKDSHPFSKRWSVIIPRVVTHHFLDSQLELEFEFSTAQLFCSQLVFTNFVQKFFLKPFVLFSTFGLVTPFGNNVWHTVYQWFCSQQASNFLGSFVQKYCSQFFSIHFYPSLFWTKMTRILHLNYKFALYLTK